tara:strand:+ start:138 stop:755 length:618 start_codon:yes stop_codon:yes gene_type:complete
LSKETKKIEDLVFDSANVRNHPDRNKKAIRDSIKQFGGGRSILIDADDVIRAGNGTAEAWQETGGKVRVIETDGSELIAVKRTDLKGAEAIAYAIADNRSAELAEWDYENLELMTGDLSEELVSSIGFEGEELNRVLAIDSEVPANEIEKGFTVDKETYDDNPIKSMNLFFDADDYILVQDFLESEMENLGLSNYAEVLVQLARK